MSALDAVWLPGGISIMLPALGRPCPILCAEASLILFLTHAVLKSSHVFAGVVNIIQEPWRTIAIAQMSQNSFGNCVSQALLEFSLANASVHTYVCKGCRAVSSGL